MYPFPLFPLFFRLIVKFMRYVLFSTDPEIIEAFRSPEAFFPTDDLAVAGTREECIAACVEADMLFVDLVATLDEPNKIAGYEAFHEMVIADEVASKVPLVLISPPTSYDIDFMVGWPDFVFANMPRPVSAKLFRRASTWI